MSIADANIYLVGLMGSGKTTLGRLIARKRRREFIDVDHELVKRTGVAIPVIFDVEGESGFRIRETELIHEVSLQNNLVVATGGGAVLNPANRSAMSRSGTVIYLHVALPVLFARTRRDTNRPLLQVADPMKRLEELYAQRDPLYREIANIIIDSSGETTSQVMKRLERELEERA